MAIDTKDNIEAQTILKRLAQLLYQSWLNSGRPQDPEGQVKHVKIMLAGALERCNEILRGK